MKKIICYALIIILLFLLFLPPILRRFGKVDKEVAITKSKNVVMVLKCSKQNEKINTSYLNGQTYNLQYQIKKDLTNEELNTDEKRIKEYAKVSIDKNNQTMDYRVDFNSLSLLPDSLKDYAKEINEQKAFYTNLGYTCSMNDF